MALILLDDTREPQPRLTWPQTVTLLLARTFVVGALLLGIYLIAAVLS